MSYYPDVVAVLTSTVLPLDGIYKVKTLGSIPKIKPGTPHYVGHPATAAIVEGYFGAVKADSNLFPGLAPWASALVVSIKRGRSSRSAVGKTVGQDVVIVDLVFRILTRVDDGGFQIL